MNIPLCSTVSSKKNRVYVVSIVLVYAALFLTEHLIPAVTFHERKFHGVGFNDMGFC